MSVSWIPTPITQFALAPQSPDTTSPRSHIERCVPRVNISHRPIRRYFRALQTPSIRVSIKIVPRFHRGIHVRDSNAVALGRRRLLRERDKCHWENETCGNLKRNACHKGCGKVRTVQASNEEQPIRLLATPASKGKSHDFLDVLRGFTSVLCGKALREPGHNLFRNALAAAACGNNFSSA